MTLVLALSTHGLPQLLLARSTTGGTLPLFNGGWCRMWDSAWNTWVAIADGYPSDITPLLDILALPAVLGRLASLETSALISALVFLVVSLVTLGA